MGRFRVLFGFGPLPEKLSKGITRGIGSGRQDVLVVLVSPDTEFTDPFANGELWGVRRGPGLSTRSC